MSDNDREASVRKPAANVDRQIQTLVSHGVHFDRCNEAEAGVFLTDHTYFFKLKAFDNKFEKDPQGNYYNLDFSELKDISTVDYHIRQAILELTSDIEHCLKVRFNELLMRQTTEDGYSIVQEFIQSETHFYHEKFGRDFTLEIEPSAYTKAVIDKYGSNPPAWLLWEVCSFKTTNDFYKFFLKKKRYEDQVFSLLDGVRKLRNAASHNNCLLTAPSYQINQTEALTALLEQLIHPSQAQEEHDTVIDLASRDPLIHDLSCVLCCHINLVVSPGIITRTEFLLDELNKRIVRNMSWYEDSQHHCHELERQLNAIVSLLYAFKHFSRTDSLECNCSITRKPKKHITRRTRRSSRR